MTEVTQSSVDGIVYREALPDGWKGSGSTALMLHGYPTSSYLWRNAMQAVANAGYRAIAPDLPGFGDSPAKLPGTWEHQIENVETFRQALGLDAVALVVHDWGGLIGLRWACDYPDAACALVISDTGFFPEGRWHGMAKSLKTEGEGEAIMENMTRDLFAGGIAQVGNIPADAIDEYWKAYADADRRQSQLDLYRSGDFAKLEPYAGKLAALEVPTLILWGEKDPFAPVGGAHRLNKQIPHSELAVIESGGHFLMEDEPERYSAELVRFLATVKALR